MRLLILAIGLSVSQSWALNAPVTPANHTSVVGDLHMLATPGIKQGSNRAAAAFIFNGLVHNFTVDSLVGMTTPAASGTKGIITATGTPATLDYVPLPGVASALVVSYTGSGCVAVTVTSVGVDLAAAVVDHNVTIDLDAPSGNFYANPTCKTPGAGVLIASGTSSVSGFYFKAPMSTTITVDDITAGTLPLLASGSVAY